MRDLIKTLCKILNIIFVYSHEKTPMDDALTRGKMDVIDAINTAVAQIELTGISVSSMET